MTYKRKENFINDKRRVSYLCSVYTRIYRGQSVLIEGAYGVGKTQFLELIKPKKMSAVNLEFGMITVLLSRVSNWVVKI